MAYLTRFSLSAPLKERHPFRASFRYTVRWAVALASQFFPWILKTGNYTVSRNGYVLRVLATPFSCFLYRFPEEFRDDEAFIQSYLKKGDVYIDIGANIGTTTLAAAVAVGDTGRVHTFEAHPRIYGFLSENIAENPSLKSRIHSYQCALGNDSGEVLFSDMRKDDVNHVEEHGSIKVPLVMLDGVLSGKEERIHLLKVDVEGYEKYVFQGASQVLAITEAVYFESYENNFKTYGYALDDVLDILTGKGFTVYSLEDNQIQQVVGKGYQSSTCENLVALRDLEAFEKRMLPHEV